jgi:hypothetical protein
MVGSRILGSLTSWGTNTLDANVILVGQQLNISLDSVSIEFEVNTGWGRKTWGTEVWGGEGIWEFVSVTGQQLNLTLNSVTPLANANVDVTGEQLNVAEGEVDPSPDATVTGIGMICCFSYWNSSYRNR